jgi:hypothetical protein
MPAGNGGAGLGSRRLREIALLGLGVITPLGILAVNASAFVMVHLTQFRIGIAACAVISGLVLNGLTAWWLLRLASRNAPPLYREYRLWAIGVAVLIVLLTAGAAGYLTYLGLKDPARLPDPLSVVVATFTLLLPLGVAVAGRRMAGLGGIFPLESAPSETSAPDSLRRRGVQARLRR